MIDLKSLTKEDFRILRISVFMQMYNEDKMSKYFNPEYTKVTYSDIYVYGENGEPDMILEPVITYRKPNASEKREYDEPGILSMD